MPAWITLHCWVVAFSYHNVQTTTQKHLAVASVSMDYQKFIMALDPRYLHMRVDRNSTCKIQLELADDLINKTSSALQSVKVPLAFDCHNNHPTLALHGLDSFRHP